jgi:hypothetical protein
MWQGFNSCKNTICDQLVTNRYALHQTTLSVAASELSSSQSIQSAAAALLNVDVHINAFRAFLLLPNRGAVTVTDSNTNVAVLTVPAPNITLPSLNAAISGNSAARNVIARIDRAQKTLATSYKKLKKLMTPSSSPTPSFSLAPLPSAAPAQSNVEPRRSARINNLGYSVSYDDNQPNADVDADTMASRPANKRKYEMNDDELVNQYLYTFRTAANTIDNETVNPYHTTLCEVFAAAKELKRGSPAIAYVRSYKNITNIIYDAAVDTLTAYFILCPL